VAFLNTFDLVIISRSVPSGDYQNAGSTLAWNSDLTAPAIIMGGYVLRNSRLGFTTGGTIPDTSGTVRLTVNEPEHPIFEGIALDEGNTMINDYASLVTFNEILQRGISVNTDPVAGEGTVLAVIGTEGDSAVGGMVIGEWAAGATLANAAGDTLGGHRLVFLSGSREHGANPDLGISGLTSHGAGIYDLDADGAQMFANAVNYMAEPKMLVNAPVLFGNTLTVTWQGGTPPFLIQKKQQITDPEWTNVMTTSERSASLPITGPAGFIRVVSGADTDVIPFTSSLRGEAEIGDPTPSSATGFATFALEGDSLSFHLVYEGLTSEPTAMHIHGPATSTESIGVLIPFPTPTAGLAGEVSGTVDASGLTEDQWNALLTGRTYLNLHTVEKSGGEIRGQVAPIHWVAQLSGDAEVPPITTTGTGSATLILIGNQLTFDINYSDLQSEATAAHIHGPADTATPAGVLVPLPAPSGQAGNISGGIQLSPSQLGHVIDGMTYINIHTTGESAGEIRGQIVLP
jgi:hypothetical protein